MKVQWRCVYGMCEPFIKLNVVVFSLKREKLDRELYHDFKPLQFVHVISLIIKYPLCMGHANLWA